MLKLKIESKIMKIISATLLCLSLGLSACVTPMDNVQPMAKIDMVTNCKSVGNISSSSVAPYGFFTGKAKESILNLAKREGGKLGATHVVLDNPTSIDDTISVDGKAYSCD
jgi:hypothetical protein